MGPRGGLYETWVSALKKGVLAQLCFGRHHKNPFATSLGQTTLRWTIIFKSSSYDWRLHLSNFSLRNSFYSMNHPIHSFHFTSTRVKQDRNLGVELAMHCYLASWKPIQGRCTSYFSSKQLLINSITRQSIKTWCFLFLSWLSLWL